MIAKAVNKSPAKLLFYYTVYHLSIENMIQVLILSVILILLAVAGLGIKMFFDKKAEFKGSSCGCEEDACSNHCTPE